MKRIRVLIADDSAVFRLLLGTVLREDPGVEVVGEATNGLETVSMTADRRPDVLTLDVEMPGLAGPEVLDRLAKMSPRPVVIMVSRLTERGSRTTLDALCRGATDFVLKPAATAGAVEARRHFCELLLPKIHSLGCPMEATNGFYGAPRVRRDRPGPPHLVAVGTSTGGPNALSSFLGSVGSDFPLPVIVVQHMPPMFTKLLAERLSQDTPLRVREAENNAVPRPGEAWIAPGNRHMTVEWSDASWRLRINDDPPENFCRPSVDVLFRSVALACGGRAVGIILTGMGQDGLLGCRSLREAGGVVLAQDQASSIVWGMPGAVVQAGLANEVVPLEKMAESLKSWVNWAKRGEKR